MFIRVSIKLFYPVHTEWLTKSANRVTLNRSRTYFVRHYRGARLPET